MLDTYSVDRASISDAEALADLGRRTFTDTFGHLYDTADLDRYLNEAHAPALYEERLRDLNTAIWLVREKHGDPVAYAMAGKNALPAPGAEPRSGEIKRIYVDKAHAGRGIGRKLVDITIEWLSGRRFVPIYVGVYSDNETAQHLYEKYGFEKVGEYKFPVGDHEDLEFILKRTDRRKHG